MSFFDLGMAAKNLADVIKAADQDLSEEIKNIVYVHCGLAVASGLIPVPGADIAAAAANIWAMYLRINHAIGLDLSENAIKTIASGIAANVGGAVAGVLLVGSMSKFIPGIGSVGGGVLAAGLIAAITMVSAIIYINAIPYLADKRGDLNFTSDELKEATEKETPSKSELKDIVKKNVPSKEELEKMRKKAKEDKKGK